MLRPKSWNSDLWVFSVYLLESNFEFYQCSVCRFWVLQKEQMVGFYFLWNRKIRLGSNVQNIKYFSHSNRFGVCCFFTISTSGTFSENCTYIRNPGFPSTTSDAATITYTVNKAASGKDFFRTCNVLPFSCTHFALWRGKEEGQGKRPEVHAKQKGFKNF